MATARDVARELRVWACMVTLLAGLHTVGWEGRYLARCSAVVCTAEQIVCYYFVYKRPQNKAQSIYSHPRSARLDCVAQR